MRALLVTACGCTRILDVAEKVRTIELCIPPAPQLVDWLGPIFVPGREPTAKTRTFEYQREKIRCGTDSLRVFREVIDDSARLFRDADVTGSAPAPEL